MTYDIYNFVEGDGVSDLFRALEEIAKIITRKMLIIWMVIFRSFISFITMFRLLGLFITEEDTIDLMHI